jgi:hypothetical protein
MEGLAIRVYEITIEGSDAARNIGSDQCRVIIIPGNMTIQDVDAIVQKSSIRYPVAATTDVGIMLETKTNILLGYIHDMGQALFNKMEASHSTTNRERERGLMEADEVKDLATLNENSPTNIDIKQIETIQVELWMVVAAVGCVAFGFVAGVGAVFVFKILPK